MICENRNCDIDFKPTNRNQKYHAPPCRDKELALVQREERERISSEQILNLKKLQNDKDCRYCKNANHTGFCSNDHEKKYYQAMIPVQQALERINQKRAT